MRGALIAAAVLSLLGAVNPARAQADDLSVFAAASLTDLTEALAGAYEATHPGDLSVVTGASSTLARQIESGAPADIFISANREWADYVTERRGFGEPVALFGNGLVVVSQNAYTPVPAFADLPVLVGEGRLAIGDPDHVPAGVYARAALEAAGVWAALEDNLVPAADVRSALGFVTQGAAEFGIVYATDAAGVVEVLIEIDPSLYPPIVYYAVTPSAPTEAQRAFLDFLQGDAALAVARELGFTPAHE